MTQIESPPDVDRKSVDELIEWIKNENFYLPSFQRRFVWDSDDIKDFVDSILEGFPVGVIILWRPSNIQKVDRFSKPLLGNFSGEGGYLILDGQQRLTAFLLMFNKWKIQRGNETISVQGLTYNPNNNRVTIGGSGVDLSVILRAFSGDIDAYDYLMSNYRHRMDKLREIAYKIKNYRLPIYIIKTRNESDDVSAKMTEAFIRINREGVRIGTLELMLSYLGGQLGGYLVDKIRNMHDNFENEIGLELQALLRFVFSNMGIKPTEVDPKKFEAVIKKKKLKSKEKELLETLNKSEKALKVLVDLLKEHFGIKSLEILPSQITLVPIAKFLYEAGVADLANLSDKELKNIEKWFVLANFGGYYSSQTNTKLQRDLELIKNSSSFPVDELLKNMKQKRVKTTISYKDLEIGLHTNVLLKAGRNYLFLLYLLLVKNEADNWVGKLIKMCEFSSLAKHHIFPREFLKKKMSFETSEDERIKINNLGNITFIDLQENIRIDAKDPKEYLSNYEAEMLERHFIPVEKDLWDLERYDHFLEERVALIYEAGKRFYNFFK